MSETRLHPYVKAAGGSLSDAAGLYAWNIELGSALWEPITYFEVAFRNAIAHELDALCRKRHPRAQQDREWPPR